MTRCAPYFGASGTASDEQIEAPRIEARVKRETRGQPRRARSLTAR